MLKAPCPSHAPEVQGEHKTLLLMCMPSATIFDQTVPHKIRRDLVLSFSSQDGARLQLLEADKYR